MIRRLILLAACLLFIGFIAAGCEQTRANLNEVGYYARGLLLDGSDLHSHAR